MTDIETISRKGQGVDWINHDYPPRPHVGCHCQECEPQSDGWLWLGAGIASALAALALGAILAFAVTI